MPGIAVDTNILGYAAGVRRSPDDDAKIPRANELVAELIDSARLVIPAQVLAELHHLLRRKALLTVATATDMVLEYAAGAVVVPSRFEILEEAFALATVHGLQTYDAIILSAAAFARCDALYSEDMQAGFVWGGVRIINPLG